MIAVKYMLGHDLNPMDIQPQLHIMYNRDAELCCFVASFNLCNVQGLLRATRRNYTVHVLVVSVLLAWRKHGEIMCTLPTIQSFLTLKANNFTQEHHVVFGGVWISTQTRSYCLHF